MSLDNTLADNLVEIRLYFGQWLVVHREVAIAVFLTHKIACDWAWAEGFIPYK